MPAVSRPHEVWHRVVRRAACVSVVLKARGRDRSYKAQSAAIASRRSGLDRDCRLQAGLMKRGTGWVRRAACVGVVLKARGRDRSYKAQPAAIAPRGSGLDRDCRLQAGLMKRGTGWDRTACRCGFKSSRSRPLLQKPSPAPLLPVGAVLTANAGASRRSCTGQSAPVCRPCLIERLAELPTRCMGLS